MKTLITALKSPKATLQRCKAAAHNAAAYSANFYRDVLERLAHINVRHFAGKVMSALAICVAFALFSLMRDGVINIYMSMLIPVFFADVFIILVGELYRPASWMPMFIAFMMTAGSSLQVFMTSPDDATLNQMILKQTGILIASVVISLPLLPLISYACSGKVGRRKLRILLTVVILAAYIVMLLAGTEINGAKSWIYVFEFSIQVTEITKVLTVFFFALCLSDAELSDRRKAVAMLTMLLMNAAFLMMASELGTLFIIALLFIVLQIVFFKNKKILLRELAVITAMCVCALGASYLAYRTFRPVQTEQEPPKMTVEQLLLADYKELEEEPEQEPEQPQEIKDTRSPGQKLLDRIAGIYPKLKLRYKVFLHDASADETHQIDSALAALSTSSWLGTPRGSLSAVPMVDSDFVFIYLVVRMGILGAVLLLLSLAVILIETVSKASRNPNLSEFILAVGFILCIVFQSLICCCSNLGLFPIVGLPMPFISAGGSALITNMLMCVFILYAVRAVASSQDGKKEVKTQ